MRFLYLIGLSSLAATLVSCHHQNDGDGNVLEQKYVHKYGVAVPPDFWAQSGEHGAVVSSMADGVIISRSYSAGIQDGETTYTFPHSSQVQKREIYNQGVLVKETVYYFDATPQMETKYNSPPGFNTVSTWYHNGTPRSVEQFNGERLANGEYYSAQNQRDAIVSDYAGTRLVRDDDGVLTSTDIIQGGVLSQSTTYHPGGSPKEVISYENGVVSGTKKTYHPGGEPNTIEAWSDGKQEGTTVVYQYGEKYAEVPYANGVKHGTEVRYRDGQDVAQEVSWNNGQQHGPTTTYVGTASKTDWYYKGSPMSQSQYDYMVNRQAQ